MHSRKTIRGLALLGLLLLGCVPRHYEQIHYQQCIGGSCTAPAVCVTDVKQRGSFCALGDGRCPSGYRWSEEAPVPLRGRCTSKEIGVVPPGLAGRASNSAAASQPAPPATSQ